MNKKIDTKNKKVMMIFIWVVISIVVIISLFARRLFGDNNIFSHIFSTDRDGIDILISFAKNQLPMIIRLVIYIFIVLILSKIIRSLMQKSLRRTKRGRTTSKLMDSFIRYFTALVIIILVLIVVGVDPVALFASVGILGLIVGLGAQSLISDIISGLFIVFEGEYEVGDYIVIEGFRGKVESIGLRTTQFVDFAGNVKIINNSEIRSVVNLSYDISVFFLDVKVKHSDFSRAETIINQNLDEMKKALPNLVEGPYYVGPSEFANEGVSLRFIGKSVEELRFQSERDVRRQIKLLFDKFDIEIALPKIFVEQTESNRQKEEKK